MTISLPCRRCGASLGTAAPNESPPTACPACGEPLARSGAIARDEFALMRQENGSPAEASNGGPVDPALDEDDDDDLPIRKKREEDELDMTPMVDVTFLLLIFFMVTASFSLQKSIPMPRQTSDLPSTSDVEEDTEELDPVELEIDEFGAFLVIGPRGEQETVGKQNLIAVLRSEVGDQRDAMRLNIKVHENAKLQFLVDGMDAGTIARFSELQVTQVDGFD